MKLFTITRFYQISILSFLLIFTCSSLKSQSIISNFCGEDKTVDTHIFGMKDDTDNCINVPNPGNVLSIHVEVWIENFDCPGNNFPDNQISINGNNVIGTNAVQNGGSALERIYRYTFNGSENQICLGNLNSCEAASMVIHVERSEVGAASVVYKFDEELNHSCIEETINIGTSGTDRDIEVIVPVHEKANDNREVVITASSLDNSGNVVNTVSQTFTAQNAGNEAAIYSLTLPNVNQNFDRIKLKVCSPDVNGASVGLSAVAVSTENSCASLCGTLDGLYFYDQATDAPAYGPIQNNEQISLADLPTEYYLVAQTSGNIESVTFWVDGYAVTENVVSYTFPAGAENGTSWSGGVGTHNIDANAYNQDNGAGEHCGQIWLTFEIVACNPGIDIVNNGNCPVNVYKWQPSGDIFQETLQAGSSFWAPTQDGQMWRVVDTDNIWSNLLYDESITTYGCDNVTWTVSPDYCCNPTIDITNNGNCEIDIYRWLPTGDVYETTLQPGGSSSFNTEDEQMWRAVAPNFNTSLFDESFTVYGCDNATWNIQANYCAIDCGTLDGIYFYDQQTDQAAYGPIQNNEQININDLPANYYLVAQTSGAVESVTWLVDGYTQTENVVLYTFPGGAENGDNWSGGIGTHNLQANAYNQDNGNGELCGQIELTFYIDNTIECLLDVGLGDDQTLCEIDNLILTPSISGISSCEESCLLNNNNIIAHYDMNDCYSNSNDNSNFDFSELTAQITDLSCATVNASNLYKNEGAHSCTQSYDNNPGDAMCVGMNNIYSWSDNHPQALRFTINLNNSGSEHSGLTQLQFRVFSPSSYLWNSADNPTGNTGLNNYNTKYGFRILKDGAEIYQEIDLNAPQQWELITRSFIGNPAFSSTGNSEFEFEFLAYDPIGNGGTVSVFDFDDIMVYGDCCTATTNSDLTYLWSTGEISETISVNSAGTYSVTVTDCEGCTATDEIVINEICSTLTGSAPADISLECDDELPTEEATFSSDCNFTVSPNETTIGLDCGYQLVKSWTATDECGNELTVSQTITIVDTTNPTGTAPADVTVECDDTLPNDQPIFADNCDNNLDIAPSEVQNDLDCGYEIIRTWTATDDCGNSVTVSQTITVVDTTNPTGTAPADVTVECDDTLPNDQPSFTDNCDNNLDINPSEVQNDLDCGYEIIRTWTATDDCGNSVTVSQTIKVIDTTNPTGIAPADLSVDCEDDIPNDQPSFTDNCDNDLDITANETQNDLDCGYEIIRTWFATDDCGNISETLTQTITITDSTAPTLSVYPEDYSVQCLDEVLPADQVEALDNCSEVTLEFVEDPANNFCGEGVRRTWTATDACGNQTVHIQSIFINDTTAPVASNEPADVSLECQEALPTDEPTFTDNCDQDLTITSDETSETIDGLTTITRTWTATDDCGNATVVTQIITQTCMFDLALTKVLSSAGPFAPGDDATFTITVINQGNLDASSVTITDYIPADMTLNDADWNADGTFDLGALAAGTSTSVDITLTIDENFNGTEIINITEISDAQNSENLDDKDSTPDGDNSNDAGGNPNSPSDNTVDGDGTGTPGDNNPDGDEDDQDPALLTLEQTLSIGSTVFADNNNNGIQDANEDGIEGVEVLIFSVGPDGIPENGDDIQAGSDITDSNGDYFVGGLEPGDYYGKIMNLDPDYTLSSTDIGSTLDPNNDSDSDDNGLQPDGDGSGVWSNVITLSAGNEPTNEAGSGGNQDSSDDDNGNMTLDFGFVPQLSIGSTVFADNNDNGVQDANESGIEGIEVLIFSVGPDGIAENADDIQVGSDITDADGNYFVDGLLPGDYYGKIMDLDPNYTLSSTDTGSTLDPNNNSDSDDNGLQPDGAGTSVWSNVITLSAGDEPTNEAGQGGDQDNADDANGNMTLDFGFVPQLSIGSTIFADNNNNGIQDANEPGIEGVEVLIFSVGPDGIAENGDDVQVGSDITDANGNYFVDGLLPGDYYGKIMDLDPEYTLSSNDISSTEDPNNNNDSDDNGLQPDGAGTGVWSNVITLSSGDEPTNEAGQGGDQDDADDANGNMTLDFGFVPELSIGSTVFVDNNDNGIQDNDDDGIEGILVEVFSVGPDGVKDGGDDSLAGSDTTDENGNYFVDGLLPGDYYVKINEPSEDYPTSSTDIASSSNPNNDQDNDDNGQQDNTGEMVMSDIVTLEGDSEPTGADENASGGDQDDADDDNGNMTIDFGFVPIFDLALTKELTSAGPFAPGDEVTYTINVINQGSANATSITLVDYVPAGMTNNDADWAGGVFELGALAAGASTSVEITLTIDSDFTGGDLVNFAEIADATNPAETPDIDSTPDTDDSNDAGGQPDSPADNNVNGNGTGTPGDDNPVTDEDDHDPATLNACDAQGPVVECPDDLELPCNSDTPEANTDDVIASDPFGIASIEFIGDEESFDGCTKVITRTYRATDNCGNSTDCTQTISIPTDSEAPVLSDYPEDFTVQCLEEIEPAEEITATDNCTSPITVEFVEDPTNDFCGDGVRRTWTATDACGNQTIHIQSIFVNDTTAPIASDVPADVTLECNDPLPTDEPTFTDNCEFDLTIDFEETSVSDGGTTTITRTWTATDHCQNATVAQQIIIVECEFDLALTKELSSAGPFAPGDDVTFTITVINQGDIDATSITLTDYAPAGSSLNDADWNADATFDLGALAAGESTTIDVTLKIDENFQGSSLVNFAEISDAENAEGVEDIDSTPDADNNNDAGGEPGTPTDNEVNEEAPIDEDDHDPAELILDQVFDLALIKELSSAGPFAPGDDVTFTITVVNQGTLDATDVVISDYIPAGLSLADADWNADGTFDLGNLAAGASTTIDITLAIDDNFNGSQLVNFAEISNADNLLGEEDQDSTPDSDNSNDAGGQPDSPADNELNGNGNGTPGDDNPAGDEDDHDPASIEIEQTLSIGSTVFVDVNDNGIQDAGETGLEGITVEVFNVGPDGVKGGGDDTLAGSDTTDEDGNYFVDGLAPGDYYVKINTPLTGYETSSTDIASTDDPNNNTDSDDNGQQDAAGEMVMSDIITLSAGDEPSNEDGEGGDQDAADDDNGNMTVDFGFIPTFDLALKKTLTSAGPFGAGSEVTYEIEVINQGTADATSITIIDYAPDGMQNNDADWNADGTFDVGPLAAGTTTTVEVTLTIDADFAGGDLINFAEIADATNPAGSDDVDSTPDSDNTNDAGGQPDSASDNAVNGDGTGTPGDENASTDEDDHDPASLNACDGIDPIVECPEDLELPCNSDTPAPNTDDVVASDPAGIASIEFIGDDESFDGCTKVITRTYRATDNCGNSADCTQTITIPTDSEAPVLSDYPENFTVQCLEEITPAEEITATDNCTAPVTVDFVEDPTNDFCGDGVRRTWTATDACGNQTIHIQSIFINDTTAPEANDIEDIELECGDDIPENEPTFTDNCNFDLTITMEETTTDINCGVQITRTWTAEDHCGNVTTSDQVITITDNTDPVLSGVPANESVECDEMPDAAVVTATDICDGDIPVEMTEVISDGCPYTVERTYTATDACGNVATATQVITVNDETAPELIGVPANYTAECGEAPAVAPVTATDNCSSDLTVEFTELVISDSCPIEIERTWTVTDACGNTTEASQSIFIDDTTAPELIGVPADIAVECDEIPAAPIVTATDNCDNVGVDFTEVISDGCPYTITRTWSASDACGNTNEVTQTITVTDNIAPVLVGVPDDVNDECSSVPSAPNVTATDNCDTDVIVTLNEETVGNSCPLTVIRTWTATDACGNTAEASQTIIIDDTIAPEVLSSLEDITVECTDIPDPIELEVADNCDIDPDVIFSEQILMQACGYVIVRTYSIEDLCGNEAFAEYTITVVDTTAPVLSSTPADITVSCGEVPTAPSITATDACDGNIDVSFSQFGYNGVDCEGQLTRVWTAEDACGNEVSHTQIITIEDTVAPTLVNGLEDLSLMCEDNLPTDLPTYEDNCDDDVTVTVTETTNDLACGFEVIRTFTATDDCGNVSTSNQTITVLDQADPVLIDVPADATVECDNIPASANVTASDDCSEVTVEFNEVISDGCPYDIIRTWTAVDECGNSTSASQVLTVIDSTLPEFSNPPADLTVECDDIPAAAQVSATDNCSDVTIEFSEVISDGCPYDIIRTWTATDACGNVAAHTQVITVEDTQAPILNNVPADYTAECGDAPALAPVTASDNCSNNIVVVFSEQVNSASCPISIVRTWTATDGCGNIAEASQNILISDEEAPVLSELPADLTVECDNIPAPANVTATDNCTNPIVEFTEVQTDGCPYQIIRTWSTADDCGNETSHVQTITVEDTNAPVFSGIPADFSAECGDVPSIASPSATDNCSADVLITFSSEVVNEACPLIIERTWTAVDACGNTTSETQTITFDDQTAPVMSGVPENESVECDNIPAPANVTATDNCDSAPVIEFNEVTIGQGCTYELVRTWTATDACGNASQQIQTIFVSDTENPLAANEPADVTIECGDALPEDEPTFSDNCDTDLIINFSEETIDAPCGEILVRQWMGIDDCGNTTIVNQLITITDTTAPTVTGPTDANIDCSEELPTEEPQFSDICDDNLSISLDEDIQTNTCGYVLTRTYTASDECGNTTDFVQVITVTDGNNPSISAPADETVECDAVPAPGNPIASDLCDDELEITFEEVIGQGCPYTITRTWTATDDCGNSSSATQTITVVDTVEPELIGVPANITIDCESIPSPPIVGATDNCGQVEAILTETTNFDECPYTLTRTWTTTDACGNTASASQVITIIDNVEPELIDFEGAINVQCDESDEIYIQAEDNCTEVTISIVQDLLFSGNCYGTIERTYLVEDECGNSLTVIQYLFLEDDIAPTFDSTPEETITILCGEDIPEPETLTASDNCDTDVVIAVTDQVSNGGNCPYEITRTYTALDACGNSTDFVQTIDVIANPLADSGDIVITSAPNPFTTNNKVTMTIPQDGFVQFTVVNTLGQEVQLLIEGELEAEILYEFELQTQGWDDGVYYLKLFYKDKFESHKIIKVN